MRWGLPVTRERQSYARYAHVVNPQEGEVWIFTGPNSVACEKRHAAWYLEDLDAMHITGLLVRIEKVDMMPVSDHKFTVRHFDEGHAKASNIEKVSRVELSMPFWFERELDFIRANIHSKLPARGLGTWRI